MGTGVGLVPAVRLLHQPRLTKGDFETIAGLSPESVLGLKPSKHIGYKAIHTYA